MDIIIQPQITSDVNLVTEDLLQELGDSHDSSVISQQISTIDENPKTVRIQREPIKTILKKRGRKRKEAGLCSERSFRLKWLNKPELKDWLTPVPNKPAYVACKWCKALLRAHLHDLKKHATSQKHRKHSFQYSTAACQAKYEASDTFEKLYATNSKIRSEQSKDEQNECQNQGLLGQNASSADVIQSEFLNPANIGFIGAGNMAQALISGLISNGLLEASNVIVSAPSSKNLLKLKPLGIKTTHDNKVAIMESDMVFLAVKPHVIPEVFGHLEPLEGSHNPLFISIATGLTITRLEAMLSHVVTVPRIIRVMPNTPCMVLQGCCVYSLGTNVQPSEGKVIKCLLGSIGICEEVPEHQMDAVCGLAGSGPAYIYAAIEAMADGAVKMGLPRNLAMALSAQTVKGAATMVLETGRHPAQLKDEVCSPGGTTITALHVLEKCGIRNAFMSAVEASAVRSKELG